MWKMSNAVALIHYVARFVHWLLYGDIPFARLLGYILGILLLRYLYKELTHKGLVISPFAVPKELEEAGLTPVAMANRVRASFSEIVDSTKTTMKQGNLASLLRDDESAPVVEMPGAKVDLQGLASFIRTLLGVPQRRVRGDIIFQGPALNGSPHSQYNISVTVQQGQDGVNAARDTASSGAPEELAQCAAALILQQVNPYVFAIHKYDLRDYEEAAKRAEGVSRDLSKNNLERAAAYNLWGNALCNQGHYDEAIAKYQQAIEIDPKYVLAYNNWGGALGQQKKYDEAIAKFQQSIGIDPKYAYAYCNWGITLGEQKKYNEAIAKFQKAIEIDPKYALPYNNWGNALQALGKNAEAAEKFARARDLSQ